MRTAACLAILCLAAPVSAQVPATFKLKDWHFVPVVMSGGPNTWTGGFVEDTSKDTISIQIQQTTPGQYEVAALRFRKEDGKFRAFAFGGFRDKLGPVGLTVVPGWFTQGRTFTVKLEP